MKVICMGEHCGLLVVQKKTCSLYKCAYCGELILYFREVSLN